MLVALEEFMVGILWLVKACLLLLYARMAYVFSIMFDLVLICCSSGLREGLAVKITTRYCLLTFIVVQVLYLSV